MALRITDRKVFTDYFNGPNLDQNTSDFKFHLYGSVTNMTKIVYTIDINWGTSSSVTDVLRNTPGTDLIRRDSGSFIDDQISIGDVIDFEAFSNYAGPAVPEGSATGLTVTAVGDDFIIINGFGAAVPTGGIWGEGGNVDGYHYCHIRATNQLTGLVMNFGLIQNNDSINFRSALDETTQGYYAAGIGGSFVDADFLGAYKGSQTGSLRVRFDSYVDTYTQRFIVEHTLRIIPYYLDGQDNNLENLITPPPFDGVNSLKYVAQYEFRNVISDENTSKTLQDEQQLGSVSWWNQNYNGFNNIFSVNNLSYQDSSLDPADSLIVGEATKVLFRVTSEEASFVDASSIVQVVASFLPSQTQYERQTQTFNQIWQIEQYRDTLGNNTATGQTIITNLKTYFVDANNIDVEIDIVYTGKSAEDKYVIGIEVANNGVTSNDSNKALIKVDFNNFQKSSCIEDLLFVNQYQVQDHEGQLVDSYGGYNEDGIILPYDIDLNHALEARINSMEVMIVAFNPTTKKFFIINSEVIPFETEAAKNDGVYDYQEITTDQIVGYKLDESDEFNRRTINTGALAAALRNYSGKIAVKIPWQEWLQLPGADQQFTDVSLPNNGLNKMSSNYNLLNGYELRPWLKIGMSGLNDLGVFGSTDYYLSTPSMDIGGYYDNPNVTGVIEYTDQSGNPVTKGLLTNENTNVRVLVSPNPDSIPSASYGILRIEIYQSQSDREIYEHSSIKTNYIGNAFIGTLIKNTVGSSLEFLSEINSDFINENTQYKVSFVLRCPFLSVSCLPFITERNGNITVANATTGGSLGFWNTPAGVFNLNNVGGQNGGYVGASEILEYCTETPLDVTQINVSAMNIQDPLPDFSDFVNITRLQLSTGYFSGMDFSVLPNLVTLWFGSDGSFGGNVIPIPLIDVSSNLFIEEVRGNHSDVDTFMFNKPSIREIYMYNNKLNGTFDASDCPELEDVRIGNNATAPSSPFGIDQVNVLNSPKLVFLFCERNRVANIDLTDNTLLQQIRIGDGSAGGNLVPYPVLDLTNNPNIKVIYINNSNNDNIIMPSPSNLFEEVRAAGNVNYGNLSLIDFTYLSDSNELRRIDYRACKLSTSQLDSIIDSIYANRLGHTGASKTLLLGDLSNPLTDNASVSPGGQVKINDLVVTYGWTITFNP